MKKISVLLCEDHTVVREGLRCVLEAAEDMQVLGEAENGHESVREAQRLLPDVVVMDMAMPLLNGAEAARQITKKIPSTKVLILSGYRDDQHLTRALEAGASGYLVKEKAAKHLLLAIREVQRGNSFFDPPLTKDLVTQMCKGLFGARVAQPHITLTSRETEVLQLVAEGYANKQIAGVLSISVKTVEKHRMTLMQRLDIHDVATLTRYAVCRGIVENPMRLA